MTPGGPVPSGVLKFREDKDITVKDGASTFADIIRKTDGMAVPVSVKVRRVQTPAKASTSPFVKEDWKAVLQGPAVPKASGNDRDPAIISAENEIIRLAQERLNRTRELHKSNVASASEVLEAETELAVAEARGDPLKQAEARLKMATKNLQVTEELNKGHTISATELSYAKQRKLEAELEVQRARASKAKETP